MNRYVQEDCFGATEEILEHPEGSWKEGAVSSPVPETLPLCTDGTPAVLDLFSGMGGMAVGFVESGFQVTGVDQEQWCEAVFAENSIGKLLVANLGTTDVFEDVPVVTGGPPCRPWSIINQQLRGEQHPDQPLLDRFFEHVAAIRPELFLMENVPALQSDPIYQGWWRRMEQLGYSLGCDIFCYANYGAATRRQRLFTFGVRGSRTGALEFLQRMQELRRPARTVGDAIGQLRDVPYAGARDHVWPDLTTISSYAERYATGRYGWRRLTFSESAPSFGNVTKTYILHPDSDPSVPGARVLSVRELLLIMGFGPDFIFPERMPLAAKYQMLADAISPVFSRCCARVVFELLWGPSR